MDNELIAVLAAVAGGRVYWVRAPQSLKVKDGAFIVLNRISGLRDYHFAGPSGRVESRVQMDVYADTYTAARDAAREAVDAVSGYAGGTFQGVFVDGQRDLPTADAGEVLHLFRTSIDIIIHHGE